MTEHAPTIHARLRLRLDDRHDEGAAARRERSWRQLLLDLGTTTVDLSASFIPILPDHGEAASLCAGWSVADVIRHLAAGEQLALDALRSKPWPGGPPTDDETALGTTAERGVRGLRRDTLRDVENLWRQRRRELHRLCSEADPERAFDPVPWATGDISRFALVQSRIMETWIHGWDIRQPLGHETVFDDRMFWVVDLALRTLPYALAKAGVETPGIELRAELGGTGGGDWTRTWGDEPRTVVELRGEAWAVAALASRRFTEATDLLELVETGAGDLFGELLVENLRAFA